MDKIKVLHIVTNVYDGGLEKVVYLIIKNTNKHNIDNHLSILTHQEKSFLLDKILLEGVNVVNYNLYNRFKCNFKSVLHNMKEINKLANYIKINKINVLHSHDFFPAFITRVVYLYTLLFKLYKVKKVYITLHNLFYWLNKYHHFVNRILGNFTNKIICVSNAVMQYSIVHDKIKRDKYCVIYNGVESELFMPDESMKSIYINEFNLKSNFIIIANIGVLSERKGQKYLLEAFNKIYQNRKNIYLLIFGSERNHEKEIAKEIYDLIDKYKINDVVRIISPRNDINKIYNLFDVFVMPSITEGMSLCLIESMLMKNIGLYSNIESFTEFVQNDYNGFIFENQNVNDLANKLNNIINNLTQLNYIKDNARNYIVSNFSDIKMAELYEKLYLEK